MGNDRWERLERVFLGALDLPTGERAAYLDQACGDDAGFRKEVEGVLAGHAAAGGTEHPDRLITPSAASVPPGLLPGTRLGPYEVEGLLGAGGMGEVYRARRADAQDEQRVAIKVMRGGQRADDLLRRFRAERQILARLQHPNIATLLDGGLTEGGRPWLAMQYVDGQPITQWARTRGLGVVQRLRLFLTVCEAVRFAHANLVVHRDLKPGNILVSRDGEVRLLDFGIAKVLDPEDPGDPVTGDLLLLTPEHAAPEQFSGGAVTTATDVYALGVLLYELLAGTRPFHLVPALAVARAVRELDPEPPSRAAADPARLERVGLATAPVPGARIAGDLDSIVLTALRREPAERYASVDALAADVRRHLDGFPVRARGDTAGYRLQRFVRRHRAAAAATAAVALALVTVAVVSTRAAIASRRQAAAIAAERDVALEVSGFLERFFRSPSPFAAGTERRDTLRVRDLIAEGTRKVREDLSRRPLVQARLLATLGRAYQDLGLYAEARPLLEQAVAILGALPGTNGRDLASAQRSLGTLQWQAGQFAQAESLLRQLDARLSADTAALADERVRTLTGLGNALNSMGRFAAAESTYRRALALAEPTYGAGDTEVAGRLNDHASALGAQARFDEAEPLLRRAIAIERATNGADHPRVAGPLNNLAMQRMLQRRFAPAETVLREVASIMEARVPGPHPLTAVALNNLASAVLEQKRPAEAEPIFRDVLAMRRALLGEEHPLIGATLLNLASAIEDQGRRAEGLALKRDALARLVRSVGADHPTVANAHNNIGYSLHGMGRHREAVPAFAEALRIRRAALGASHPVTAGTMNRLGTCRLDIGDRAGAEALFREAREALQPVRAREAAQWNVAVGGLARIARAQGREADALALEAQRVTPAAPRP